MRRRSHAQLPSRLGPSRSRTFKKVLRKSSGLSRTALARRLGRDRMSHTGTLAYLSLAHASVPSKVAALWFDLDSAFGSKETDVLNLFNFCSCHGHRQSAVPCHVCGKAVALKRAKTLADCDLVLKVAPKYPKSKLVCERCVDTDIQAL